MDSLNAFMHGGSMVACLVVSLIFMRFWRRTQDRLFLIFCVSFMLLAIERIGLIATDVQDETRTYVYIIRLIAFICIIAGIVDKNRAASSK